MCKYLQFKDIFWYCNCWKHHRLSATYLEQNLFHQSKFGHYLELQDMHIFLFMSPRDMMQVCTLSVQLGLGSVLVEWYWDATSVPYGHLLIDFSIPTEYRKRSCTNTGSIALKFCIPDRLQQSKSVDDNYTKSIHSRSVEIIFPQMQKSFPSVLPERVYQVPVPMYSKSQRKPAKHKKTSRVKISKEV